MENSGFFAEIYDIIYPAMKEGLHEGFKEGERMGIKSIEMQNFTVFEDEKLSFVRGLNVFVGPNGVGKTHVMKLIYAALQSADPKVSFAGKIVRCFQPDDYRISRLARRTAEADNTSVKIISCDSKDQIGKSLNIEFNNKTSKWDASVKGEKSWENQLFGISSIFIPAKEILSNSYNLNAAVDKSNVYFDDTYLDIINSAKIDISAGKNSDERDKLLKQLEKKIGGKVVYDMKRDEFYLKQGSKNMEFPLVAEGIRKIALLWQLIKNGALDKGAVLLWDEPEANLNPVYIPLLVDVIIELQRKGVQIFISTHDYFLAKYIDVRKIDADNVVFHSLYMTKENGVKCETGRSFVQLNNNTIMDTFLDLYKEEIGKVTE